MNYYAVLTDHGAQLIEQAYQHGQVVTITQMAIGDGGGVELEPATSALAVAGEFDRVPLTSGASASSMLGGGVDYESTTHVGKWIRTLGLMDAQGNLIVYSNYPPTYIADKGSTLFRTLGLNIQLPIVHGDAVTVIVERPPYPPATETEYGVVRFATADEAIAGQKSDVAITPKTLHIAVEALLDIVCPIGQFIYYDGPTVPNDRFIVWKAQAFDMTMYPKLAAKYPSGRLPADLRSEFIRGADEGRGIVNGLLPMMSKPDQTRAHTHKLHNNFGQNQIDMTTIDGRVGATASQPVENDAVHVATVKMAGEASFSVSIAHTGGSETNPRYVAALILCRAK